MGLTLGYLQAFIGLNTIGLTRGLAKAQASLNAFGVSMQRVGKLTMTALTVPLGIVSGIVIAASANFEKAMNQVAAVTLATQEQMASLEQVARFLGETTKFTAIEAAEGMNFLAMAGFEVEEIMQALPHALNLAAAGNMELGRAADIVSNIMRGFGMEASRTEEAADILTATFTNANASLEQIGESMAFAAPVANAYSQSLEMTAAAVGMLGDAGIQASRAGTGMRQMLLQLDKKAKVLGITVRDSAGEFLGLDKILRNIERSGIRADQVIRTVGPRAGVALAVLIARGSLSLTTFTDQVKRAIGLTKSIADTQLEGLAGAFTEMKSAATELGIAFGDMLTPALEILVDNVKKTIREWSRLEEGTKKIIVVVTALGIAIPIAVWAIGKFITVISLLAGPIGLAILAIAGLVAAVLYVADNWDAIIERISDSDWWVNMWDSMGNYVNRSMDSITNTVSNAWDNLALKVSDIGWWESVIDNIVNYWNSMTTKISDTSWWQAMITLLSGTTWLERMTTSITDMWDTVTTKMSDAGWWDKMLLSLVESLNRTAIKMSDISWWTNILNDMTGWWDKMVLNISDITWWEKLGDKIADSDWLKRALEGTAKDYEKGINDIFNNLSEGTNIYGPPEAIDLMSDGLKVLGIETSKYATEFGSFTDAVVNGAAKMYDAMTGGAGSRKPNASKYKQRPGDYLIGLPDSPGQLMDDLKTSGSFGTTAFDLEGKFVKNADGGEKWAISLNKVNRALRLQNQNLQLAGESALEYEASISAAESASRRMGYYIEQALTDAFKQLGVTLGDIFSGDAGLGEFRNRVGLMLASFMRLLGEAAIAVGVASDAFQKAFKVGNAYALVAAGIVLIATSVIFTNILKKGPDPKGLASGGFITQGGVFQLHKDELVTLPLGAAVTPANMARGGGGGAQTIVVRGVITGGDLRFVLDEENRKRGNTF